MYQRLGESRVRVGHLHKRGTDDRAAHPGTPCRLKRGRIGILMDAARYSAIETLRDGRWIEIRALRPGDRDELLGAVGRMSEQSIYRRFFSPKRGFTDQEVAYFTNV